MKVLLVAPTCDGEDIGEAYCAYQWASRLSRKHKLTLLTYNKHGVKPASEQFPDARVIEWDEPRLPVPERFNAMFKPGYIPFYFKARHWLKSRLAAGETFDVAHQALPSGMRFPSPVAGIGIPFVIGPVGGGLTSPPSYAVTEHSSPWYSKLRAMDEYRLRHDPLLRRTYQCADCVLGIGSYVQDQLGSMKINRFEAMADTGLQNIPEAIDRTGRGPQIRCLYVGRLVRTKGIQEAIRSMAVTTDYEGLPLTLDVVGEGPERPICEELIAKHHLEHRVKLQGWKSKHEVARFYRGADIFIFPSYREPGGNVVSEAMSYSLPLIIIDRGGPSSATTDECAIRIPVSNPEQAAYDIGNAIRRLVDNPDLRHRMGASAYAHAQRTALWSSKVDAIDAIYERAISDHISNTAPCRKRSKSPVLSW